MSQNDARPPFGSMPRRPVRVDGGSMVRITYSHDRNAAPVTLEPAVEGLDLTGWLVEHRALLDEPFRTHGGVLLRGFGVTSASSFEPVARTLCRELFTEYGDLPAASAGAKVYRSTPYPEDKSILFHNESSHLSSWPRTMCFCCIQPAEEGGETPLADSRLVYERLPADLRSRFERDGLLYVRNFVPGLDVGWREFFRTDDRTVVEAHCRAAGTGYEWWGEDNLRTTERRPAVIAHPETSEPVFFNQILLHHISCLDPDARDVLLAQFGADRLPRQVHFGDGTPIPDAAVEVVRRVTEDASRAFGWQTGDVLFVDNVRLAHSRRPYRGARRILVAMGDMATLQSRVS